jgi:5-methylthioadenosine/S-adenosylhomocysteine deaminase
MSARPFDLGLRCRYFLSMANGSADPSKEVFLGIRDGKIAEISAWSPEKAATASEFIDGRTHVAMPGMINVHMHLAMTLFKGVGDDLPFHDWLFKRILPLEAALVDPHLVRVGTELALLESIRFGVTTVSEMYFFAETAAHAIDRAGMRGWVGQAFASGPLPEDKLLGKDKSALFESLQARYLGHERITAALAPHAPYTCDDDIFREVVRLSEKHSAPIHTHLSETAREVQDSLAQYGKTPVQRLFDLGVLTPRTLCAHCVHLDEADTALMKKTGASVAYNPDSNMKLGSGIAPITRYRKAGIPVGFGSDGSASNNDLSLFGAMDIGTKLQKLVAGDNTAMVAADALVCATWEGARALGLQSKIGSLEVGKEADVILVNLDFPHLQPVHDVRSQLVYAAQGLEVDTVICRGRTLLRSGEFVSLDRERIMREVEPLRAKIHQAARD